MRPDSGVGRRIESMRMLRATRATPLSVARSRLALPRFVLTSRRDASHDSHATPVAIDLGTHVRAGG